MIKRLAILLGLLWCLSIQAAEVMPPKPDAYFNDYAHVASAATASELNHTLADFERQTSSQILVAVFPKMQSDSSIEDYTVKVARSWGVGQKDKNNGAVLFVFVNDHKMFIQVGYGLEGAIPDITAKRIVSDEIAPRFKQGDFDGGLKAGVTSLLAAAKGEYKGTGRTVADNQGGGTAAHGISPMLFILLFVAFCMVISIFAQRRGSAAGFLGGWLLGSGGFGGSSGGGWSGGSGGGGGGGGDSFSGGGGSFGGGGAGGSW